MKSDELVNVTFPYNYPYGERAVQKFRKLINTARELGGTVYEVAADAGLFSAERFFELLFDDTILEEPMAGEDMTVVTEVYVHYKDINVLERVFLASDNAAGDERLLETGSMESGKLIIEYDKLKSLHEKGYKCFYQRVDEKEGLSSNRFKEVFGKDQKMIPFKMWDSDCTFIGSGFNQAILVRTMFETVLVMPDIYAVEQCIKAVYAEKLIQERYEPTFSIERMERDAYVIGELELVRLQLFGRRKMKEYEELRNSYRKLTQQVAYIKVHYLMVYELVWDEKFEIEDERSNINWDEYEEITLGVSISEYRGCYAVFRNKKGKAVRVPDFDCPKEMPLHQKYQFKGCGNMKNVGVAASRIALTLKNMKISANAMFDVNVKKVYITFKDEYPSNMEIFKFMNERKKKIEKKGITEEEDISFIADSEFPHTCNLLQEEFVHWVSQLADFPEIEVVENIHATMKAFELFDKKNSLNSGEIGLIYEMDEDDIELILFEKQEDGTFRKIAAEKKYGPAMDEYYDEEELDPEEYNPNLDFVLGQMLDNFMMDAGLRALEIYGENENDEEAFEELKNSAPKVRRQLRRNDNAKVIFNNGYLNMLEDFPMELFEECYKPLLERNIQFLQEFLLKEGYGIEDIHRIYSIGSEWEYPFVRKYIEEIADGRVSFLAPFKCVVARGAAFMDC